MQGKQHTSYGPAESYVLQCPVAILPRQMLMFEKAAVFASFVLEFGLVFAEHVDANRVVVVLRYWTKQLQFYTNSLVKQCSLL